MSTCSFDASAKKYANNLISIAPMMKCAKSRSMHKAADQGGGAFSISSFITISPVPNKNVLATSLAA